MQIAIDKSSMSPEQMEEFDKLCCKGIDLWDAYDYARQTQ